MRSRSARASWTQKNNTARPVAEALEARRLLSVDILTWHDDLARTGVNASETQLTPANVRSASFGKLFSYPVNGQLYAEPLYVSKLNMGVLGTHDVVFVATEHNDVYALDADNPDAASGGGTLWHVNLGTPATTPSPYIGGRYGPWSLVTPNIGIEGTPVIDRATNTMYLDSFTNPSTGVYAHHMYAIDITSGANKVAPVLVSATYPGNGAGGDGTTIPFIANRQQQRPALTLLNGVVYVAYGSFDDTDPHHGWVLGYDAATLQLRQVWNSTPTLFTPPGTNPGEGPIWQSGAGLSSDGSNLYAMTGNGDFNASLNDYADSFVKLSTANDSLNLTDYFTPLNQQALTDADEDLGSAGPMVLPDSVGSAAHPHLLIGCGKDGNIYLIDRNSMGHYDTAANHVVQQVQLGSGTWSNPTYFNGRVYFHGVDGVLKAYSIANGVLSSAPVAQGSVSFHYPGATPSISANGTSNGIIWELQYGGYLHASDASTLADIYNTTQAGARDQIGSYIKFTTPTVADGKVFVGASGTLSVFGLFPQTSILGTGGNDAITLKQDTDHQHIDWTMGSSAGQVAINDAVGLIVTGNGGVDTITLDSTNGDPLPDRLDLNGTFVINGFTATILGTNQTIDVGSSLVTIPYSGTSPLPAIQAVLRTGYNNGAWNGSGIVSSAARADSQHSIALTDSALGAAPGQAPGTVQLRYALTGDVNQDGQVDFTDLVTLARSYRSAGNQWSQGDFNYDSKVDFKDLVILAANYGHRRPDFPNLLQNGDFSQGNSGFVSGYTYNTDLDPETTFTTGFNPSDHHTAGVASFGDHTTGSGQMLLVNGAVTANVTVWQETVAVTPGTQYNFSAWAAAWGGTTTDPSPAVLQVQINGQPAGANFTLPNSVGQWAQFSSSWNSGVATTATIRIVDLNTTLGGNDFALDDLSFVPAGAAVTPAYRPRKQT